MAAAITQDPQAGFPAPTGASLELALHAAQAGVWEWNLRTDENRWTDEVWRLYGLSPGSQPPSFNTWLSSVHPDDRDNAVRVISEARRAFSPFETSWRTNPDRGPVRWILSRGQPGLLTRDGPTHYVGIVMDITTRKLAEEEIQRLNNQLTERVADRTAQLSEHQRLLQTILDGVPGLIAYWDKDLRNRFANQAYGEWFGTPPEAIHGRHITELLGNDLYELNKAHIEAALRGQRQCFLRDLPVPGQPGLHRVSEAHYLPDFDGDEVKGFLVLVLDVTDVKRAEQTARAASQAKSDFLANVSHELRTPLNTMFGLAQIGLKEGAGSPGAGTFRQILESGQHLLSLIDEVLDFSKIEAGKMHLHLGVVDIGRLIEQVLGITALRACSKGIQLVIDESVDVPAQTLGDAKRLSQILVNLLTNAIKFTDQGEVRLSLSRHGSRLHIKVSDTGMGIPPERLSELFQPFVQVHDTQGGQAGTGLGLAICKQIVDEMGGEITVRSVLGIGTTFEITVDMPYSTEALSEAERLQGGDGFADTQPPALADLRLQGEVLLVEDNEVNAFIATMTLESLGVSCQHARNGEDALALFGQHAFDVILMDCEMPVMDGYEAARRIRQMEAADTARERTPVIALTAHALSGDREVCLANGMDDYLTKPFDREALALLLSRWLPVSEAGPTSQQAS